MPLGYGNSTHSLTLEAIKVVFNERSIEEHKLRQEGNKGNSSIKVTRIYRNHES
jgi:hypothetical protein